MKYCIDNRPYIIALSISATNHTWKESSSDISQPNCPPRWNHILFWKTKPRSHQMIPQIGEADATEKERRIDSSAIRGSSRCHWRCKDLITNLKPPSHHNLCYHPHCLPTNRHHIIIITTLTKKLTFRWFSILTRTANATKAGSNHF